MNYQDYIKPELLTLVPALYLLGTGLKKSRLPDKFIPLLLGGTSILLSALWVAATAPLQTPSDWAMAAFTATTQGILVAGAGVYANQLYLQAKKEE